MEAKTMQSPEEVRQFAAEEGLAVVSDLPMDSEEPTRVAAVRPAKAPGEVATTIAEWRSA